MNITWAEWKTLNRQTLLQSLLKLNVMDEMSKCRFFAVNNNNRNNILFDNDRERRGLNRGLDIRRGEISKTKPSDIFNPLIKFNSG